MIIDHAVYNLLMIFLYPDLQFWYIHCIKMCMLTTLTVRRGHYPVWKKVAHTTRNFVLSHTEEFLWGSIWQQGCCKDVSVKVSREDKTGGTVTKQSQLQQEIALHSFLN